MENASNNISRNRRFGDESFPWAWHWSWQLSSGPLYQEWVFKMPDSPRRVFGPQAFTYECCRDALVVDYSSPVLEAWEMLLLHYASEDATHLNNVTENSQRLHRIFGITKQNLEILTPVSSTLKYNTPQGNSTVNIRVAIRGWISYLTELHCAGR